MVNILFAFTLHFSNVGYNWLHPHFQYQSESGIISGIYYNSLKNPSVYLGRHHTHGKWWFEYGAVTGYHYPAIPMFRGGYQVNKRINLFTSPMYDKAGFSGLVGVEIKLN